MRTDPGRQRRDNEDATFARAPVFVLADGMGGAQAGEVAAAIVAQAFARGMPDHGSAQQRLTAVIEAANQEIHERSLREREHAGMGTTVTAAYLEGDAVAVANVGDSRAYLFREGALTKLTSDHSLVEELVKRGELTDEEALEHPQRSIITRALGPEPAVEVDTFSYPLLHADVVLLCSDGLTDMILERQVRQALTQAPDLAAAAQRLIDEANAAGGRDNITVILFRVEDARASELTDQPTEAHVPDFDADERDQPSEGRIGSMAQAAAVGARLSATPAPALRAPLARLQGWKPRMPAGFVQPSGRERHFGRLGKTVAALGALVVVLFLIGGGGYLASRQLYFLGTNGQGTVVVFRGFPYVLPFGVPMYETFYVSGVPASTIPADRRHVLLNHELRDQTSATRLINGLELGKISG